LFVNFWRLATLVIRATHSRDPQWRGGREQRPQRRLVAIDTLGGAHHGLLRAWPPAVVAATLPATVVGQREHSSAPSDGRQRRSHTGDPCDGGGDRHAHPTEST